MPDINNHTNVGSWSFELKSNQDCNVTIGNNSWLDFSSLAKGLAIDLIGGYLKDHDNYLVDIGGELLVKGTNNNSLWNIGLQDPKSINNNPIYIISTNNWLSIATSGEYRNYKIKDNKKISHTINPKTLNSINNNLLSVTVITYEDIPVTTMADAYATAFNEIKIEKAYEFANKNNMGGIMERTPVSI
jgi:Membrane-associated lipoprotein involved in thiamine biosynthesis